MYFHDILLSTLGKRRHHSFEQLTKLESSSPTNATCAAEIRQCIFTSFRLFPLLKNARSLLYPIALYQGLVEIRQGLNII